MEINFAAFTEAPCVNKRPIQRDIDSTSRHRSLDLQNEIRDTMQQHADAKAKLLVT